jgi:hypothetical protein
LSTLPHALEEERHFALAEKQWPVPTKARSQSIQVRISIRPMHLFGHNCDHDYYFELLFYKEEQDATINYSMFDRTPSPGPGCPAREPNLIHC